MVCSRTFDIYASSQLFGSYTLYPSTLCTMNASGTTRFAGWYGPITGPLAFQHEFAAEPPYAQQAVFRVGTFESPDKGVKIAFKRVRQSVCSLWRSLPRFQAQELIACHLFLKLISPNVPDGVSLKICSCSRLQLSTVCTLTWHSGHQQLPVHSV